MLHGKTPVGKSSDQKISKKLGLLRYDSDLNKSIVGYKQGLPTGHVRKTSMTELNIRPDIIENTKFFNKRPKICDPTYAKGTQYKNSSINQRAQVMSPQPNLANLANPSPYWSNDQNYRSEPCGGDIWGLGARLPYSLNASTHKPHKNNKKSPSSYRQNRNNQSIDFHNNSIMSNYGPKINNHNNSSTLHPQDFPGPANSGHYHYSKISNSHSKNLAGLMVGGSG
jgi:hypothetical protein